MRTLRTLALALAGALSAQAPMPVLRVGVDADYPPFEYADERGWADGFTVDVARAVSRDLGIQMVFEPRPWPQLRRELTEGRLDFIAGMFRSAEREATLVFSRPHIRIDHALFVRREPGIPHRIQDFGPRTVFVPEATYVHEQWHLRGLPGTLVPVLTEREALRRLAAGDGHGAVVTRLGGLSLLRELRITNLELVDEVFERLDYCFATPKARRDLMVRLDASLERLRRSGELEDIRRKWFGRVDGSAQRSFYLRIALWSGGPALGLVLLLVAANRVLARRVAARTAELRFHQEHLEVLVQARTAELEQALGEVKRLSGFIPICASCKNVRNDQGYWTQVEAYISERSEATFSHGLCPDCIHRLYPELSKGKEPPGSSDRGPDPVK